MEPRYTLPEDVKMRLDKSYIRYKGKGVFVESINGSTKVNLYRFDKNESVCESYEKVSANDPDLDISSPPLGFADTSQYSVYMRRMSIRRQKQGLNPQVSLGQRAVYKPGSFRDVHDDSVYYSRYAILDMIDGKYKNVELCIDMLDHDRKLCSASFHRDLCLIKNVDDPQRPYKLWFKGNTAGIVFPKSTEGFLIKPYNTDLHLNTIRKFLPKMELLDVKSE